MRRRRSLRLFGIAGSVTLLILGFLNVHAISADISHAYHADTNVQAGSLVSLDPSRSNYVLPSDSTNASRLLGIAVSKDNSLVVIDPSSGTLQVAISGSVNGLVSTINGPIKIGDQISASPISGVGMKALPGNRIVGIAQSNLNTSSSGTSSRSITDKSGNQSNVQIGYIKVTISVGTATDNQSSLNFLQRVANNIAGHSVTSLRIFLSLAVLLFAVVALTVLIYASIHSSIIAIGRNPLAQISIFKTLGSAIGLAVLTAAFACLAIFELLH